MSAFFDSPPAGHQDDDGEPLDAVGDDAETSDSNSETEDDDDDEEDLDPGADEAFWNGISWDELADAQPLEYLDQPRWVERDDDPTLQKNKARSDGANQWVSYIPEWTDPDFDKDWETVERHVPAPIRRNKGTGDVYRKLRPALRPADEVKNPSEWARRWGIHPRETGGRSRTTPIKAGARRFVLSKARTTPSGEHRNFLDLRDLEAARGDFARSGPATSGLSFSQALEQLTNHDPGSQEAETAEGLLSLMKQVERDEAHQRYLFTELTTDEVSPFSRPAAIPLDKSRCRCSRTTPSTLPETSTRTSPARFTRKTATTRPAALSYVNLRR